MKNPLTKTIVAMSRIALFGAVMQCLFFSLLLADETADQPQSINDIHLSIHVNGKVVDVFNQIEEKTEFRFSYNKTLLNLNNSVSVNVSEQSLSDILLSVSRQSDLRFRRINESIHVAELRRKEEPVSEEITALQAMTVTGKVTSRDDSESLPGVNVIIGGTDKGTVTDINGSYSIEVPGGTAKLVFSSVGYVTQEVDVANRSIINVVLASDVKALSEIVVTALGIEKDSRTLGYATATAQPAEFAINRSPNVMNALQGKMAGVNISAMGTGPAGTTKIRIRGQSSIAGQNNPLIVINGVPIDNTNFGAKINSAGSDASVGPRGGGANADAGDGLSSINPDDVESITVLKGAAAAALYGSRAKDGVIMVTTKTKGDGKGIGVTYNMNYTSEKPLDFTDYQYDYGQGEQGVRPTAANPTSGQWSFGEKFAPGMTQVLFDGVQVPYVPVYDRIDKFFRNGQNFSNTISLSSGGDVGGFNLSIANLTSKGIVPNNEFKRNTINFGFDYNLSKKLKITGNINYANERNTNPPNIADQDNTIPVALFTMANSMPYDLLDEKKYDANGNEFVYSRFRNRTNPYWTLAEVKRNVVRDRIFGNIAAKYDLTDWLSIQGRLGQDYWSRDDDYINYPTGQASRAVAPAGFVNGLYTQESRRFRELNADFILNAFKEFGKVGLNLTVGGNHMYRRSEVNSTQVQDFVVRGLYTVQNSRVKDPQYSLSERAVNSLYGSAEVSYNSMLYLTGTIRNDWFSTLSDENRSIVYPSVAGSFVFSDVFGTKPSWLDFGKVRVAYAEVGSDTDVSPYSNLLFYGINANLFLNQPVGNISSLTVPNPNLRPMRTSEWEVGLELKTLNNRVGLDVAYFDRTTIDQIVSAEVSDGSGFTNTLINSGESEAKGVEMLVNLVPVQAGDFQWNFTFNATYVETRVNKLLTDTPGDRITVGTHVFNGELRQVVGEEMGQLAGFGYLRNENGEKVFGANGLPLRTPDLIYYGSALPKWYGGFNNEFTYKKLSFSFLIDFKLGNKMMSGTNFNAVRHGLHKMTLEGREGGVVGEGVNQAGEVNTVVAPVQSYWEIVRSQALIEPIVYNGGYWKLRQITLGYDLGSLFPDSFFIKGARLSFVANNVLMLKKWVDNIDPESFGFNSDNLIGLESTGMPSTRSIGFNLNVKF
ncbi:MAG: SusC/RagA family TonB-linked outer membrane protein [Cyclobacteriaceae bacterium]|nr:SusC/RagA family TonB-linked outer membrane protein [Cyclobacteriaceae bacterium]